MAVKQKDGKWFVVKKSGKLGKRGFLSKQSALNAQKAGKKAAAANPLGTNPKKSKSSSGTGGSSGNSSGSGHNGKKGRMKSDSRGRRLLRMGVKLALDPRVAGVAFGPALVVNEAQRGMHAGGNLGERILNGFTKRYTGLDLSDMSFDFRSRAGPTYTAIIAGFVGHGIEEATGIDRARTMFLNTGSRKSAAIAVTQAPGILMAANEARLGLGRTGFGEGIWRWYAQRLRSSSGIDVTNRGRGAQAFAPQLATADIIAGSGIGAFGVQMHKMAQESINPMIDPSRLLPAVV